MIIYRIKNVFHNKNTRTLSLKMIRKGGLLKEVKDKETFGER
ncbi:hypothetical protein J2S78_000391 [Salibacterium salarium]|nr:hypothetical protein [Salibacterium salarium]